MRVDPVLRCTLQASAPSGLGVRIDHQLIIGLYGDEPVRRMEVVLLLVYSK